MPHKKSRFRKDKSQRPVVAKKSHTISDKSLCVDLGVNRKLKIGVAQNQGKRPYQEDSYGFSNLADSLTVRSKGVLAVLADGMGGLSNGKEVSSMAVSGMIDSFNSSDFGLKNGEQLFACAQRINTIVCNKFSPGNSIRAGSTLVCALIQEGTLHWTCIGDSRIYLRRNNRLYQVNEDHDYLNQLLEEAIYDNSDTSSAFSDRQKDVLVSCLGNRELKGDISIKGIPLYPGDTVMLCSDGIYNALPLSAINLIMQNKPQTAAEQIEAAVIAQGFQTQDNLTIIILNYN